MSDVEDRANEIRVGEELEAAKLEAYLKTTLEGLKGNMQIRQFPGGHSNLTYLLTFGNREMVLRRPPFGTKVRSAHDMGREYTVLKALSPVFPLAPRPLLYTEDTAIIGCPFYVMERLHGIILRNTIPEGMTLSADEARQLCRNMIEGLYKLHSVDYRKVGLEDFGKPEGYVKRQVEGWNKRYRDARTPDVPDGEDIITWLEDHMPPDSENPGIVHGDWKPDNLVLDRNDPTKVIGVLDWEMATIGDPIMDVCYSLIYFNVKSEMDAATISGSLPPVIRESVSREELLEHYQELSGRPINNPDFYYAFNMFRLGGLLQQIYYRFYHGISKDRRFKVFKMMVQMLMGSAQHVIGRSSQ